MLKIRIVQARLQQDVNHELPDVQAGFRKDVSVFLSKTFFVCVELAILIKMWLSFVIVKLIS